MKRFLLTALFLVTISFSVFAGDAAAFVDIGYSADGKVYVFGQYGKTDIKYQPYAELYTVDVEKNEYVPGFVFKNLKKSSSKSGKSVYEDLFAKHYLDIKKFGCEKASANDILYVAEDSKKTGDEEIIFKDFEDSEENIYSVKLIPTYTGKGNATLSSFYINLKIQNGEKKTYTVGSPSIRRKGVTNYKIIRIVRDKNRNSLVFVVEKQIEDDTGVSIRYMIETIKVQ